MSHEAQNESSGEEHNRCPVCSAGSKAMTYIHWILERCIAREKSESLVLLQLVMCGPGQATQLEPEPDKPEPRLDGQLALALSPSKSQAEPSQSPSPGQRSENDSATQ